MTQTDGFAGRVAVVTGGTDGIGAATARALRARGADVVVLGRSPEKADRLLAEIAPAAGPGSLRAIVSDFAVLANVRSAVERLHQHVDRIDHLVHAVGVLITRAEYTAEGLEMDFAISYLSRFLFLEETFGRGLLHAGSRLVNIAASATRVPRFAQFEFSSIAEVESRTGMRAHGQAQLANDLLTAAAPARYGITAIGYGPGAVDTQIRREVPAIARAILTPFYARATRRPEQAADDILAALTDPDLPAGSATFRNRKGSFPSAAFVSDRQRQADLIAVSRALVARTQR